MKEKKFNKLFLNGTVSNPKSNQNQNEWLSNVSLIPAVPTLSFMGKYFNLFKTHKKKDS